MAIRKVTKYLLIVLLTIGAADIALGIFMHSYVKNHVLPGDYQSLDYLLKDFDNDIVILGSSVALNNLDPEAIGDSLHRDVYNGASNGQTLTYHLTVLKSLLQRHKPQAVIMGIKPIDFSTTGPGKRIGLLSPYYGMGYESIDSALSNQSPVDRILVHSSLYRYNTIWFRIMLYQILQPPKSDHKGFVAKDIPPIPPTLYTDDLRFDTISAQRHTELKEAVNICRANGIKLIVFFPPQYINFDTDQRATPLYKQVKQIIEDGGMILYDDTELYLYHPRSQTLFYDNSHLNKDGAQLYTDHFIRRLLTDSIFSH